MRIHEKRLRAAVRRSLMESFMVEAVDYETIEKITDGNPDLIEKISRTIGSLRGDVEARFPITQEEVDAVLTAWQEAAGDPEIEIDFSEFASFDLIDGKNRTLQDSSFFTDHAQEITKIALLILSFVKRVYRELGEELPYESSTAEILDAIRRDVVNYFPAYDYSSFVDMLPMGSDERDSVESLSHPADFDDDARHLVRGAFSTLSRLNFMKKGEIGLLELD